MIIKAMLSSVVALFFASYSSSARSQTLSEWCTTPAAEKAVLNLANKKRAPKAEGTLIRAYFQSSDQNTGNCRFSTMGADAITRFDGENYDAKIDLIKSRFTIVQLTEVRGDNEVNFNSNKNGPEINATLDNRSKSKCQSTDRLTWDNCIGSFSNNAGQYEGEFRNGRVSGYGTFKNKNGNSYSGYWENAKFNGQGTLRYADGRVEAGIWKDGTLISRETDNNQTRLETVLNANQSDANRKTQNIIPSPTNEKQISSQNDIPAKAEMKSQTGLFAYEDKILTQEASERIAQKNNEAIARIDMIWNDYSKREKTILEQVLNYTTTGNLEGENSIEETSLPTGLIGRLFGDPSQKVKVQLLEFWLEGTNGENKCILTKYAYERFNKEVINFDVDEYGTTQLRLKINALIRAMNTNDLEYRKKLRFLESINGLNSGGGIFASLLTGKKLESPIIESRRELLPPMKIDLRKFYPRSFSIKKQEISSYFFPSSSNEFSDYRSNNSTDEPIKQFFLALGDDQYRFITEPKDTLSQDMGRLENAWKLAFQQCEGKKSAF